jgi:hypothetical protein
LGLSTILGTVLQFSTSNKTIPIWTIILAYTFVVLMMLGAMIIWSELVFTFPKNIEPRLRAFKYILIISYTLVIVFFCILYRNLSHMMIPIIVPLMITIPLSHYLFNLKWFANSVSSLKKRFPRKVFFVFALMVALVLTSISYFLSNYINVVIDKMSQVVVQIR